MELEFWLAPLALSRPLRSNNPVHDSAAELFAIVPSPRVCARANRLAVLSYALLGRPAEGIPSSVGRRPVI